MLTHSCGLLRAVSATLRIDPQEGFEPSLMVGLSPCLLPIYRSFCGYLIPNLSSCCTSCLLPSNIRPPRFPQPWPSGASSATHSVGRCSSYYHLFTFHTEILRSHFLLTLMLVVEHHILADVGCESKKHFVDYLPA